jgi:hypothetical protein
MLAGGVSQGTFSVSNLAPNRPGAYLGGAFGGGLASFHELQATR